MSGWLPPPPPPPVPSYPPGEYEGGSALYDALSQFFLVMILVGCQHPQLLIDPIVGLLRCLGGILSRCLSFIFDCVYEVNDRFEIFSSSPRAMARMARMARMIRIMSMVPEQTASLQ